MRKTHQAALSRWVDDIKRNRTNRNRIRFNNEFIITVDQIEFREARAIRRGSKVEIQLSDDLRALLFMRRLRRILDAMEVPYYIGSTAMFNTASISSGSVEVLDADKRSLFYPSFLLKARARLREAYFDEKTSLTVRERDAYFISAFDNRDGSYFFCEVPGAPSTLAEAYEALKPEGVKLAEEMGRNVKRQGDIFAIPQRGFKTTRKGAPGFLLDTNHMATQVLWDGDLTYARGVMRHAPEGRRNDHPMLVLGPRWHLIVQNTVPLVK